MIAQRTNNISFFKAFAPALKRGLEAMPLSSRGLVWNDPASPAIGYGFHDSVLKSGEVSAATVGLSCDCHSDGRLLPRTGALHQPAFLRRVHGHELGPPGR